MIIKKNKLIFFILIFAFIVLFIFSIKFAIAGRLTQGCGIIDPGEEYILNCDLSGFNWWCSLTSWGTDACFVGYIPPDSMADVGAYFCTATTTVDDTTVIGYACGTNQYEDSIRCPAIDSRFQKADCHVKIDCGGDCGDIFNPPWEGKCSGKWDQSNRWCVRCDGKVKVARLGSFDSIDITCDNCTRENPWCCDGYSPCTGTPHLCSSLGETACKEHEEKGWGCKWEVVAHRPIIWGCRGIHDPCRYFDGSESECTAHDCIWDSDFLKKIGTCERACGASEDCDDKKPAETAIPCGKCGILDCSDCLGECINEGECEPDTKKYYIEDHPECGWKECQDDCTWEDEWHDQKKRDGEECYFSTQCCSGNCVDDDGDGVGVCCDKPCDRKCEACNLDGSVGKCKTRDENDNIECLKVSECLYCDGIHIECQPVPDGTRCSGDPGYCCGGKCDNDGKISGPKDEECRSEREPTCIGAGEWGYPSKEEGERCGNEEEKCVGPYDYDYDGECDVDVYQGRCDETGECVLEKTEYYWKSDSCTDCTACNNKWCGDPEEYCANATTCDIRTYQGKCSKEEECILKYEPEYEIGDYCIKCTACNNRWCGDPWEECANPYNCDVRTYQGKCSGEKTCEGEYEKDTGCTDCTACNDENVPCGELVDEWCRYPSECDTWQKWHYCNAEKGAGRDGPEVCTGEWFYRDEGEGKCEGETCDNTDWCYNDTRWEGKKCSAVENDCSVPFGDKGCCEDSYCQRKKLPKACYGGECAGAGLCDKELHECYCNTVDLPCGDWIAYCKDPLNCDTWMRRRYCLRDGTCAGEWHAVERDAGEGECEGEICDETDRCIGDTYWDRLLCSKEEGRLLGCAMPSGDLGCCLDSYCGVCGEGECQGNYKCDEDSHVCTDVCNTERNPCGNCGTCLDGICTGEGPCSPGETRSCGYCALQTCQSNCEWGDCIEGVCRCPEEYNIGHESGLGFCTGELCPGGLVPCGRNCDDPYTEVCECARCSICHFFILAKRGADFLALYSVPIGILMAGVGGFIMLTAGGNLSRIAQGKTTIRMAVIGLLVIFIAWFIVGLVVTFFTEATNPFQNWHTITCPVPPY